MTTDLASYIGARAKESNLISAERRVLLSRISTWVTQRRQRGEPARLVFICTHNSRRSQLAQVWAWVAAGQCGLADVRPFSGGTEVTAVHHNAVAALVRAGLEIEADSESPNPLYRVDDPLQGRRLELYSKVHDQSPNPGDRFCAVMTCDDADRRCPVVAGADLRVALTYRDPKESDGTEQADATYDERCAEIARELLWMMRQVASSLGHRERDR